jgi:hypothetical protein
LTVKNYKIQYLDLDMAGVAQLVRASGCGPEGRGFKPHLSPHRINFWS